jgi:hypothetical protein
MYGMVTNGKGKTTKKARMRFTAFSPSEVRGIPKNSMMRNVNPMILLNLIKLE